MNNLINIVNAKVNNLKSVSLSIKKNEITVITGPSGSGKSSLAFDTIYKESQRLFIDSLSSYAKQILGQYEAVDADEISGLSPSVAIDQRQKKYAKRSTVGTITEIYANLSVLFSKVGKLKCLETGNPVEKFDRFKVLHFIKKYNTKTKVIIISQVQFKSEREFSAIKGQFLTLGFSKILYHDDLISLDELVYSKTIDNEINLVVDRVILKSDSDSRLLESLEQAFKFGLGHIKLIINDKKILFSEFNMAIGSKRIYPNLGPKLFSFNSPIGACENCNGLGVTFVPTEQSLIFDDSLSIQEGAITALSNQDSFLYKWVENFAKINSIKLNLPLNIIADELKNSIFNGSSTICSFNFKTSKADYKFKKTFPGIISIITDEFIQNKASKKQSLYEEYIVKEVCGNCFGSRLNEVANSTFISEKNIFDITNLSITDCLSFMASLSFSGEEKVISERIILNIIKKLNIIKEIGLGYLSLSREAQTLSGGEVQRIRIATQVVSTLTGVLYILDEPSIGLHSKDNHALLLILRKLQKLGNTIIMVEHDIDSIKAADNLIEIGPGAGESGGEIISNDSLKNLLSSQKNSTLEFFKTYNPQLNIKNYISPKSFIKILGVRKNNLSNLDVKIPLGVLCCVTGVSGSGKSTLIHNVLIPACRQKLKKINYHATKNLPYNSFTGFNDIRSIVELDQKPIGRSALSNPATFTGLFNDIRQLFSQTKDAKIRGHKLGRFSFNVKGGRCESCEGHGIKVIEMHLLPDVEVTCDECKGKRYNTETLSILFRGKNISDVLEMSINEALVFFKNHTKIYHKLSVIQETGLGYLKLGQSATSLSGGEAQRIKLSKELSKRVQGNCLYILDEPTTGLNHTDTLMLMKTLKDLVSKGHSVILIEHDLLAISQSDYIIDMGPGAGINGGQIIGEGTPFEISKLKTPTGMAINNF